MDDFSFIIADPVRFLCFGGFIFLAILVSVLISFLNKKGILSDKNKVSVYSCASMTFCIGIGLALIFKWWISLPIGLFDALLMPTIIKNDSGRKLKLKDYLLFVAIAAIGILIGVLVNLVLPRT